MAELPIAEFIRSRLKEADSSFEVRKGTAFDTLFFKMAQFILQPFRDEVDEMFIGNSLRRILQTEDPDAFNEELVDAVVANVYVYRVEGGKSSGVARVYYESPVSREYAANGFTAVGANGKRYLNPAPFALLESQMETQIEDGLYFMDVPIASEEVGADTEILEAGGLVSVVGDEDTISVTNKAPVRGGADRETNTKLIERARKAITVRDLVTGKGSNAILFENFPNTIVEMQPIGFGDPEMMRDVVYNAHIGGKHDQYVKTAYVTRKSQDFIGILVDDTRASRTSTSIALPGTGPHFLGETSIDRTLGHPVVKQVKPYTSAMMRPKPLTPTLFQGEIDLSSKRKLIISLDGNTREVDVAGLIPSRTRRQEIINAINGSFGYNIATVYDNTIQLTSQTSGKSSNVAVLSYTNPALDAFNELFDEVSPLEAKGDGPIIFEEAVHYIIDNVNGTIARINGPEGDVDGGVATLEQGPGPVGSLGRIKLSSLAAVPTFSGAVDNAVVRVEGLDEPYKSYNGDYRVVEKISDTEVVVDAVFTEVVDVSGKLKLFENMIKDGEVVDIQFYFNPLSIDIGKFVKLGEDGRTRGIRPGRETMTIQDVAFLRAVSIEVIDPVSMEPLGQFLEARGGYGYGGYGMGAYGYGSSSEFRLAVNDPHARFSAFEDSYLVIDSAYQGYSLRVTYDCVPEIEQIHNFCRSDYERVLDGDVLAKHFIPAFVSATIEYEADSNDSTIPDNDTLTALVKQFIDTRQAGSPLQVSDISQFILKRVDPYANFKGSVKPFTLSAAIHNCNGTVSMVEDTTALSIVSPNPYPKYTDTPISARIVHWVSDNITLVRV